MNQSLNLSIAVGRSIGSKSEGDILPTAASQLASIAYEPTELRMRISPSEEADLIARAQTGDAEAFCVLAANHQRSLYLLALKYSGNHHDAEDLTQEVMLNAYRAIRQFKGMSSFHTWLAKIMVNSFLNLKRKSDPLGSPQRQDANEQAFEAALSSSRRQGNSEGRVHNRLVMQQVIGLLRSVPERQRLMFLMKHQEGMTCEEIARTMGTSVGTVKKTLFRVVDRLRQHFAVRKAMRAVGKG
jgi:RNA polymerase sigma-70 factor (ECF subfamily)